jgi:uncharacterized protein YjaZ
MKTHWVPTNTYYHEIASAPDLETRQHLYREHFIAPFQQLMGALAPMFRADTSDEFAVARAWAWLLPEDLDGIPAQLEQMEQANAWEIGAETLREGAAHFEPYDQQIGIEQIEGWLMLANPVLSNPHEDGYTGVVDFFAPRLFAQYSKPNTRNIERFPALVAHEMHHLIHRKCFPWTNIAEVTVAEYIVHEGLAESFAKSLYGEHRVLEIITGMGADDFKTARSLIGAGLDRTGFDVIRGYIFGDAIADMMHFEKIGMPTYGGYAVGYYTVQAYLERTGQSIEEATFEPADKIVRESGFFG